MCAVYFLQCPRGTPLPIACPSGTYSDATDLASVDGCSTCPLGHACALGTSTPEPCAAGQYGSTPGQTSSACTGGCSGGHYCPEGSTNSTAVACRECKTVIEPAHRHLFLQYHIKSSGSLLWQLLADSMPTSAERVSSSASSARPTRSSQHRPHRPARTVHLATSSPHWGRAHAARVAVARCLTTSKANASHVPPILQASKEQRAATCASTIAIAATPPLLPRPSAALRVLKGRAAVGTRLVRR